MVWRDVVGIHSLRREGYLSSPFDPFFSLFFTFALSLGDLEEIKKEKKERRGKKSRYKGMMKDRQEKHLALILSKGKGKREKKLV